MKSDSEVYAESTLVHSRVIAAPRERVFKAWTEPEQLKKWWGPPGYTAPTVEVDLKVGGRYRIAMKPPQGDVFYLRGTFREVIPPEKLVYTWEWEGLEEGMETLVTVEFIARGRATEVIIRHERFPDERTKEEHLQGWLACMDRLAMQFVPGA